MVLRVVLTFNHPENKTPTRAAATIAPRTWTIPRRIARKRVTEPIILIPKVTYTIVSKKVRGFGVQGSRTAVLNNPPLILKNTQALTAREKPKLRLIYSSWAGFYCSTVIMIVSQCWYSRRYLQLEYPRKRKKGRVSSQETLLWPQRCGLSHSAVLSQGVCWPMFYEYSDP